LFLRSPQQDVDCDSQVAAHALTVCSLVATQLLAGGMLS